jgi:hypothetical protein
VLERGVVLEDEPDLAALRRQAGGVLAVDLDRAGICTLQAADDPQQGGLAAAARAEQGGLPLGTVRLTSSRATKSPNRLLMLETVMPIRFPSWV